MGTNDKDGPSREQTTAAAGIWGCASAQRGTAVEAWDTGERLCNLGGSDDEATVVARRLTANMAMTNDTLWIAGKRGFKPNSDSRRAQRRFFNMCCYCTLYLFSFLLSRLDCRLMSHDSIAGNLI